MDKNVPEFDQLTAEEKKEFAKFAEEAAKKQTEFLEAYRKICRDYGYDFIATPIIVSASGKELTGEKLSKITKTINRILMQEHAGLRATFRMIPKSDNVQDAK